MFLLIGNLIYMVRFFTVCKSYNLPTTETGGNKGCYMIQTEVYGN
jgi:hypothetical protein